MRVPKVLLTFDTKISEKGDLPQSISSNWSRAKVCFGLLNSSLLCLKVSRIVCRKTVEFEIVIDVSHTVAKIQTR